jgi:hypothetical protein
MTKLKKLNRWLNRNYNFALAIGILIGLLIMDLLF